MFLEPSSNSRRSGWIEVICGSMFSGKTEELMRRLRRARIADQKVMIFKPHVDTRYDALSIVSHDANSVVAVAIHESREITEYSDGADVVCIDEAQFFDSGLPAVCQELASNGVRVIVSGLDMDFRGKPFQPMPDLLAVAEYVSKLHAICVHCGNSATHSYRLTAEDGTVVVGEKDKYEARCRTCFQMGNILHLRHQDSRGSQPREDSPKP